MKIPPKCSTRKKGASKQVENITYQINAKDDREEDEEDLEENSQNTFLLFPWSYIAVVHQTWPYHTYTHALPEAIRKFSDHERLV